ncbi:cytosol non-specific dipeptidase [Anaeramoeba flamelloides]|uniref:Cytosol non-specific dipeptidase n=1 Tax=Anaeramoeba flamelloides TaxID=1746091 RepID=A0ABQ8XYS6_9EUKA|nr:cytosol non-specific dipeptidase [Anaeramoeba flamelloides]
MQVTNENNKKVLKELPSPKNVFEYFLALCEIPRCSGNMKGIRDALVKFGEEKEIETKVDEIGNVLFRKPGTKGLEDKPSVCLQVHMDMVGTKDEGLKFNFETDPIQTKIENGWLTAEGTTLGADNGIGIAFGLAVLTEEFEHGPIELLCTVDEETTMEGAFKVETEDFIKSKFMINVDSEEDAAICFGSAGGFERVFKLPLEQIEKVSEGYTQVNLYLHELLGGHTGVQIHENRANANKWMIRMLLAATSTEFLISSYTGGHAKNAIPSSCKVSVLVEEEKADKFMDLIQEMHRKLMEEFFVIETKGVVLEIEAAKPTSEGALTLESTVQMLDFIHAIPHGVMRMSPEVEGLVESSQSVSIVKIVEDALEILVFARSSSYSQLKILDQQLGSIASLSGAEYIKKDGSDFPPWEPMLRDNLLLESMKTAFKKIYKKEPHCYAIHAGLECSIIQDKYEGMIPLSIGPTITDPHSPQEKLEISTVESCYKLLKETLMTIAK